MQVETVKKHLKMIKMYKIIFYILLVIRKPSLLTVKAPVKTPANKLKDIFVPSITKYN